ncbi:aminoglycoside 6-adenylyltransferase [Candidatus Protochlamydia phocaeensis]|uniref:aminoglycoside 6-adenylyltransferase n=1 Tax=Candidatus Protochlamydia phocaeensis TaxID=1414722 RepID=UPI000839462D|nr:aminoglycoside 6-adenylyltransferase [Candidatus Protochlamydia phocaeensis]
MMEQLIQWVEHEHSIRAAFLIGSRAGQHFDELSDYDLSLFCQSLEPFIHQDDWLFAIGRPWICVHEKIYLKQNAFPSRLVIFEGGIKVDFSFFPLNVLQGFISSSSLPADYQSGYRILVDKDHLPALIPTPSLQKPEDKQPSEHAFSTIVEEFWFEAYHVAKYLKRHDLWSAKFRAALINDHFLLKMLEWHAQASHGWRLALPPNGKGMHTWLDDQSWKALNEIFARLDRQESWQALEKTIDLFRQLAIPLSKQMGFAYPHDMDSHLSQFVQKLRKEDEHE